MPIKALQFDILEIGKHIKRTKKSFIWRFLIDGKEQCVQLVASYISGKRKVVSNGTIIFEGKRMMSKNFQFPFSMGQNMLVIEQNGDYFDLRINNIDFDDINESEVNKKGNTKISSMRIEPTETKQKISNNDDTHDSYPKPQKKVSGRWGDVQKAVEQARNAPTVKESQEKTDKRSSVTVKNDILSFAKKNLTQESPEKPMTIKDKENHRIFQFSIQRQVGEENGKGFDAFSKFSGFGEFKPPEVIPNSNTTKPGQMNLFDIDFSKEGNQAFAHLYNQTASATKDPLSNKLNKLQLWDQELDGLRPTCNYNPYFGGNNGTFSFGNHLNTNSHFSGNSVPKTPFDY